MTNFEFKICTIPKEEVLKIKKYDIKFSIFHPQPRFNYGFHHFIHTAKDKTSIFNDSRYTRKHLITNPFEHEISDYDKDIKTMSELYFETKKNGIISRAFYKLWEILIIFDIIPAKPITAVFLAEAPGAFVQASAYYRMKFNDEKDYLKDKFYCISVNNGKDITFKENILKALNNITICKENNGDITNLSVQKDLKNLANEAELITADGGFNWINENYQEQEAYRLIFAEIISALRLQKKSGNFILKIFETFTPLTIKLLLLLNNYYNEVHIYKPFTSRLTNSEKYVICKDFKGINSIELKNLEELLETINTNEMKDNYLNDIFLNNYLSENIIKLNQKMSIDISNKQYSAINETIVYLNNGNFFGDIYFQYHEKQIEANDFWINTFLPIDNNDLKKIRKNINAILIKY
jgi:23S rRNA U2552 (ribose-2'-O)-methylase RlmE/FtsJ